MIFKFLRLYRSLPILTILLIIVLTAFISDYFFLPQGVFFSSGKFVTTTGRVVEFDDKLTLLNHQVSYSINSNWADKTNVSQIGGSMTPALLGGIRAEFSQHSSYGDTLLGDRILDNTLVFNRSFAQGNEAKLTMLPIRGKFSGICFYILELSKVQCGGRTYWRNPAQEKSS